MIDTGADCTHPDFMNAGGSSTDVAFGGQLLWSASQALVPTSVSSPACPWQDDYGHGTHVTGIVAAATSNGIGVASLGYPLEVIEYKALDVTGSGSDSTIANAIVEAVLAGAQVISMSLGGSGYSQTLQTAINFAWEENVVVVAAAGNSASNSLFFRPMRTTPWGCRLRHQQQPCELFQLRQRDYTIRPRRQYPVYFPDLRCDLGLL